MTSLALFDLDDFETPAPRTATSTAPTFLYGCGRHEQTRDWPAHFEECWQSVCPSCGDHNEGDWIAKLNHGDHARAGAPCGWQVMVSNHLIWDARALDGEAEWVRSACSAHGHLGPLGHEKHQWRKKPYPLECSAIGYGWKTHRLIHAGFPVDDLAQPHTDEGRALVIAAATQHDFTIPNLAA